MNTAPGSSKLAKIYSKLLKYYAMIEQVLEMEILVSDVILEDQEEEKDLHNNLKSFSTWVYSNICAAPSRLQLPSSIIHRILRKCHFSFQQASHFQAMNAGHKQNLLEFAEHCSTQQEGYSKYLSKLDFLMNASFTSAVSPTANQKHLGCFAFRLAQAWGYEQSRCYDMDFHIQKTCLRPIFLEKERVTGGIYRNTLIHYVIQRLMVL